MGVQMSLLEDRILRIIELRRLEKDDEAIAKELGIDRGMVSEYEASTKKFIQLFTASKKYSNPETIAKRTGFSLPALDLILSHYHIPIVGKERKKPSLDRMADIQKAITDGASSVGDIAERVHLEPRTIYRYARKARLQLPGIKHHPPHLSFKERVQQILAAMKEGADTVEKVTAKLGLSPFTIHGYAHKAHLHLPVESPTSLHPRMKRRPEIDTFIEQGLPLQAIGAAVHLSGERIRQYIHATDQYTFYRTKREEKNKKDFESLSLSSSHDPRFVGRRFQRHIVSLLKARLVQLAAQQETWAAQKAAQHIALHCRTTYSYEQLIPFFQRYHETHQQGEKLSLEELGDVLGVFSSEARRILRAVGVAPMYGTRETRGPSPAIKEALRRGFQSPMSASDVAYFLRVPVYLARQHFHRPGNDRTRYRPLLVKGVSSGYRLPYRLASAIYEAQDAGFTAPAEIGQLVDAHQKAVVHALKHRSSLERTIKEALRVLYPSATITKPYLDQTIHF
ncbi:hypothetical protein HYS50_02370 [Candidatus Woesearchaeota archaeon]|nr:hypothetical protein [Candidatus Woesearchaeota archaeon]